jgi:pyruvate dehydrogenase E1 component beta subunit
MPAMNLVQAINNALDLKLGQDPDILLFGEDAGLEGGVFRVTQGLQAKYGERRVFDTPLSNPCCWGPGWAWRWPGCARSSRSSSPGSCIRP